MTEGITPENTNNGGETLITSEAEHTTPETYNLLKTDGQSSEDGTSTEAPVKNAPDKYEFVAPDGKSYDENIVKLYSEVAKELDMTQDAANTMISKLAPAIEQRQMEQVNAMRTEWSNASKIDKEFGGDSLNENLAIAKKALDTFASNDFKQLINESGLGNHPEMIRLLYRAGKALSSPDYQTGHAPPKTDGPKNFNTFAETLYPVK